MHFDDTTMRVLEQSNVFSGMALENIDRILIETVSIEFTVLKDEFFRHQGETLDFYPIVISGEVQARMPRESGPMVVQSFTAGESFAEAIPGSIGACPVDIVALVDTHIVGIPADNVKQGTDPLYEELRANISREMSLKVATLSQKLSMMGETRMRPRFKKYLSTLARSKDGSYILPKTKREIAALMGVHEKAFLRELKSLQEDGYVKITGNHLKVLKDFDD